MFQGFLRGKSRTTDALEHGIAFVSAPVGPSHSGQLEGLNEPRTRNMWPRAQVGKFALRVKTDIVFIDALYQFDFVGLSLVMKKLNSVILGQVPYGGRVAYSSQFRSFDLLSSPNPRE